MGLDARLAVDAGFPPGVVNVVTGGADVGRMLVEHKGVDMVSFTAGPPLASGSAKHAAGN